MSACVTTRPSMSYVAPEITAKDAQVLATDAVSHLENPLPPARTTVSLDPPISNAQPDVLTPALLAALRMRGYGVTITDRKTGRVAGKAMLLRYLASPFESGVIMRLQYLGIEASRFYPRATDGTLLLNGAPFTVREASHEPRSR
ncbi:conjugal transfer protein TrbH [Xenorhabdus eapokensis]|uniref:conjugal transfer protein TrbH n=1 Tax=Xenorhabdus eapokensis TaxID=1873482 RepID=UPI001FC92B66|nr:conjugal transfer protein TrbH [Xenorhabdus eapokensis]